LSKGAVRSVKKRRKNSAMKHRPRKPYSQLCPLVLLSLLAAMAACQAGPGSGNDDPLTAVAWQRSGIGEDCSPDLDFNATQLLHRRCDRWWSEWWVKDPDGQTNVFTTVELIALESGAVASMRPQHPTQRYKWTGNPPGYPLPVGSLVQIRVVHTDGRVGYTESFPFCEEPEPAQMPCGSTPEDDPTDIEDDPTDIEDDPTDVEDDPTDIEDDPTDIEDDPEPECVPECGARICGIEPVCGESCGECRSGERCSDGRCVRSGIQSMRAASRRQGAAPLSVAFNAVPSSSGVIQPRDGNYASLSYRWDFGDPGSGAWDTDGLSRNRQEGFVAAHVFEQPGTYEVVLTVREADGSQHAYRETIEVTDPATDPAWRTYYVASNGRDDNDGRSPSRPFRSVSRALRQAGPNVRLLFRRGDSWSGLSAITVNRDGPTILGAYGDAEESPLLRFSGSAIVARGGNANRDWRFVDLQLVGNGSATGIEANGYRLVQGLFLRLNVRGWGVGYAGYAISPAHFRQLTFADCAFTDISRAWGIYAGGEQMALLGNTVTNPGGSHTVRVIIPNGMVMVHNVLHGGQSGRHVLKLHNRIRYSGPSDIARHFVISDNQFIAAAGVAWSVALGPQNAQSDERVADFLYERNVHRPGPNTQVDVHVWAQGATLRNNVFAADGAPSGYTSIAVTRRGVEPSPRDNAVLNNTCYRGDGRPLVCLRVGDVASNTTAYNNLAAGSSGRIRVISGSGTGLEQGHNLVTDQPRFAAPGAGNFSLRPGSPAIDAGRDVGIPYDFLLQERFDDPNTANRGTGRLRFVDIGAFEFRP
jgi:PKD repeat protein